MIFKETLVEEDWVKPDLWVIEELVMPMALDKISKCPRMCTCSVKFPSTKAKSIIE